MLKLIQDGAEITNAAHPQEQVIVQTIDGTALKSPPHLLFNQMHEEEAQMRQQGGIDCTHAVDIGRETQ